MPSSSFAMFYWLVDKLSFGGVFEILGCSLRRGWGINKASGRNSSRRGRGMLQPAADTTEDQK